MVRILAFWLFYAVPEVALMLYCGTRLVALHPPRKRFWVTVLGFSLFAVVLRHLPIPFGLHTVVMFLVHGFTVAWAFRLGLWTTVMVTAIGFVALAIGEELVMAPVLIAKGMTLKDLLEASLPVQIVFGYLSLIPMALLGAAVRVFRIKLVVSPEAAQTAPSGREA